MEAPDALALLDWYDRSRRDLPWRAKPGESADPYRVWLSEIMLQQTTVAAVKPYFVSFVSQWPTVSKLAAAPLEDILKAWAGLGYYSRARNLHLCANEIAGRPEARFPDAEKELLKLPGIGPYTAAAIVAIAFGKRAVVVDGNVERVIARLFAITTPLPQAKVEIRKRADELTPGFRSGDFAQAMMDLGASLCSPRKPNCLLCPFEKSCLGRRAAHPEAYPARAPKKARPKRHGAIFYVQTRDGRILVRTRPPKGLLGGMTEFPGSEWEASPQRAPLSHAPLKASWCAIQQEVEHVFTHFSLHLRVFTTHVDNKTEAPAGCRWTPGGEQLNEALPSVMRKVLRAALAGQ